MELRYVRTRSQFDTHRLVWLGLSVILCKPLSNFRRSHADGRIVGGFVIGGPPKHFCADRALPHRFQVSCQSAFHDEAKKVLATEATSLVHGRTAAEQAAATARATFEEGKLAESLPTEEVARTNLENGLSVLEAYVLLHLVTSKGEARRQIRNGGLRVNDVVVTNENMTLTPRDLTPEGVIKLSLGRKRHVLLKPV